LRRRFTLKERDIETGLDYFLARYYSSAQGRFTSPDEPVSKIFFRTTISAANFLFVQLGLSVQCPIAIGYCALSARLSFQFALPAI